MRISVFASPPDSAMQAIDEVARIQKFLDPHDVIKVQGETEMDVSKAEAATSGKLEAL